MREEEQDAGLSSERHLGEREEVMGEESEGSPVWCAISFPSCTSIF